MKRIFRDQFRNLVNLARKRILVYWNPIPYSICGNDNEKKDSKELSYEKQKQMLGNPEENCKIVDLQKEKLNIATLYEKNGRNLHKINSKFLKKLAIFSNEYLGIEGIEEIAKIQFLKQILQLDFDNFRIPFETISLYKSFLEQNIFIFSAYDNLSFSHYYDNLNFPSELMRNRVNNDMEIFQSDDNLNTSQKFKIVTHLFLTEQYTSEFLLSLLQDLISNSTIPKNPRFIIHLISKFLCLQNVSLQNYPKIMEFNSIFDSFKPSISLKYNHLQTQIKTILEIANIPFKEESRIGMMLVDFELSNNLLIEVYGPKHFSFPDSEILNLRTSLREKLLTEMGFRVIQINFKEINACESVNSKLILLRSKLISN